jgi:hypothetical protein
MNLFKHQDNSNLFGIDGFTDDELIAQYNVCINYKAYLSQILALPDKSLLQVAPGMDAKIVRENLKSQEKYCDNFIALWNSVISGGGTDKLMN